MSTPLGDFLAVCVKRFLQQGRHEFDASPNDMNALGAALKVDMFGSAADVVFYATASTFQVTRSAFRLVVDPSEDLFIKLKFGYSRHIIQD